MDMPSIPRDDLLDVMDMTKRLEVFINEMLSENELTLGLSALMSSSINCMIGQCKTLDEIVFYRNIFIQIFDSSIRTIKIKEKD